MSATNGAVIWEDEPKQKRRGRPAVPYVTVVRAGVALIPLVALEALGQPEHVVLKLASNARAFALVPCDAGEPRARRISAGHTGRLTARVGVVAAVRRFGITATEHGEWSVENGMLVIRLAGPQP